MKKSTLKEKLTAFYHSTAFVIIIAICIAIFSAGITTAIFSAVNTEYKNSGIIVAIEKSDSEDFKYDVSIKTSANTIFILSSNSEFTIGEIYDITFASNHTDTPVDDEILIMAKKF